MYFGKKVILASEYKPSPLLDTTKYIRRTLIQAIESESKSNVISSDDVARLQESADFIKREFHDRGPAATFSIYEMGAVFPKPDQARFLGQVSSRLFTNHYSAEHGLIVPTGFFHDTSIEDYHLFPLYDIHLNGVLIQKLGLSEIISDVRFHVPYLNIVTDPEFHEFTAYRLALMKAIRVATEQDSRPNSSRYVLASMLQSLDFGMVGTSQPASAGMLVSRIRRALKLGSERYKAMGQALEEMTMQAASATKILVCTATDVEDEAFRAKAAYAGFTKAGNVVKKDYTVAEYHFKSTIVLYHLRTSAGSMGLHSSQRIADLAFGDLRPSHAFSVGIAFGLDDQKQTAGDVLVAEYIMSYEKQKVGENGIRWRGDRMAVGSGTLSFSRQYQSREFKVFTGGMFSGEKLVDSQSFRDMLVDIDEKCVGGEMEGAGFVTASQAQNISFSLIKGISDFAAKKGDSAQSRAARNAFSLFFDYLAALHDSVQSR